MEGGEGWVWVRDARTLWSAMRDTIEEESEHLDTIGGGGCVSLGLIIMPFLSSHWDHASACVRVCFCTPKIYCPVIHKTWQLFTLSAAGWQVKLGYQDSPVMMVCIQRCTVQETLLILYAIILWFDTDDFLFHPKLRTRCVNLFSHPTEQHGGRQCHSHFVCCTAAVKLLSSVPLR